MKKILFVIFVFLFLTVGQAQADLLPIVQCGGSGQNACGFCDFFAMINRIVQFVTTRIVPVVAALMLTIGGVMFFFAGGSPGNLAKAKTIITSTVIGLVIIFAAFLIVGTILSMIGLASWTQDIYKNWWQEGFFQIPGCESGAQSPSVPSPPPTTPTPTPPAGNEPIPPLPPTPPAF